MRHAVLAAITLASLSSAAFAQDAVRDPAPLSRQGAPDTYRYDDEAPGAEASRRAAEDRARADESRDRRADDQSAWQRRDLFCRRDAAARTGYTTPREAARGEQARGTIGGTLGGAALGAIIGGAAGNAGTGAAIGAGAGLLAGSAIGADNARRAAADVQGDYSDSYYACMDTARDDGDRDFDDQAAYAPGYPPPPPVTYQYYGAPYPYYYPYRPYYGPSFGFSFGVGPSWHGYGPRRGGYYRPWRR